MKFGPLATREAEGALLAHTLRLADGALKKGHLLTAGDIARIADAGIAEVVAARLGPDDCHEDEAARRIAQAASGGGMTLEPPFTGRVNFHADADGLLVVDKDAVDRTNRIDPAITLATLPAFARVTRGRMVATAKIIPFAAPRADVDAACQAVREAVRVAPFRARPVGLVATRLAHLKPATLDKTRRITESRLAVYGSQLTREIRVAHEAGETAEAIAALIADGAELVLVFGASAIVDRDDVIPAAIRQAGGTVTHFGMPVDPGNLLLVGEVGGVPVLGAPGCARSPKENGFDWVLDRLMADLPVTPHEITGMGVGGLLMEIGTRPQPREVGRETAQETTPNAQQAAPRKRRIDGVLLAAGQSRRAGGVNKLLARIDGEPLVRIAAKAALASGLSGLTVVTGHMAEEVAAALSGLDVALVQNPDYADGMAGSIRTGVKALGPDADAAMILLADMPGITAAVLDRLIEAYRPHEGVTLVLATTHGKRGNPVLWDRSHFDALARLEGDTGARHLIGQNASAMREVEIGEAARLDLDTREALSAAGAEFGEAPSSPPSPAPSSN
ncbi:NTP transferase domain-containing protein [Stappia indica]|uniref:Molybdopterin molybdochelatase /molybdenum cofactor cytidylyltransferase n=1 Tax=Stappia indica TaxID=538381 RepID=A0A285T415_9HYPH|nr:molybdopterin-binding/glycosyltransferase family 2 protein [Stappia indica]SOC14047.1 molybdopterin molybdochelatase /molybdenum cofactor cytidylyltransferase [Stappia indica]